MKNIVKKEMKLDDLRAKAENEYKKCHYKEAALLYGELLEHEPDNVQALFYKTICKVLRTPITENYIDELPAVCNTVFSSKWSQCGDSQEYFDFVTVSLDQIIKAAIEVILMCNNYAQKIAKLGPVLMVKGVTPVHVCRRSTGQALVAIVSDLFDITKSFSSAGEVLFNRALDAVDYAESFEKEALEKIVENCNKIDYGEIRKKINQVKEAERF